MASIVTPETLPAWHRKLIARKYDSRERHGASEYHPNVQNRRSLTPCGVNRNSLSENNLQAGRVFGPYGIVYSLLLRTSAATLLQVASDPRHLGAEIGFFSILHTWNQKLQEHAHVHSVVPAGGLSPDQSRWIAPPSKNFFLPHQVLAEVFRGKFVDALREAFAEGKLCFHGRFQPLSQPPAFRAFLRTLYRNQWVVSR